MSDQSRLYTGREQTLVKHFVLEHYLERFAHIIGSAYDTITYVDGFSGPWNVQSDELKDSSFCLALNQLRRARNTHADLGKTVRIRCLFLERESASYGRLKAFADTVKDAEIQTLNADFEASIPQILSFIRNGQSRSFPFIFIDPTGWTGFAADAIAPLLRVTPGEVLINLMTGHIRRFIDSADEETQESFERLFGSAHYHGLIPGLAQQDREDQLVRAYTDMIKCTGGYAHVCPAIVLHPQMDRTHFHLIYATRSTKGLEVFKDVEKRAMEVMEKARAKAQQDRRVQKTGQMEMFASEDVHDPTYYEGLRDRYLRSAYGQVLAVVRTSDRCSYDDLWLDAMSFGLVWESDLRGWLAEWAKAGYIRVEGMRPRERVLKRGAGHSVVNLKKHGF
jgi:three-Cys-motif partner protein